MKKSLRAVTVAAFVFLVGCSGGATVSGTVTLDGVALKSGTVTFHPVGSGPVGIGSVDSSGRYEIMVGTSKSLPPGEYIVTVVATEPLDSEPKDAKGKPMPPKAPKQLTPDRYASKDKSDLKKTVTSGSNTIDLTLTK